MKGQKAESIEKWVRWFRALLLEPNKANFFVTRLVTRREYSRLTI